MIAAAAAMAGDIRWVRPAAALAALEVAVRGGGAALAGAELVGVHGEAHRAAGHPPLEAGLDQLLREPLRLGLGAHEARARHDHGPQARLDPAAPHDLRRGAQVLDPAVGAGADEHGVDLDVLQPGARGQAHVLERAPRRVDLAAPEVLGVRDDAGDRQHVLRAGAPGDDRGDRLGVEGHLAVQPRALVGEERPPVRLGQLPGAGLRRVRAALDVVEGRLVGGDQAGAGAALDRHVADRHAAFHRQRADRLAAVFDDMAGAAGGAGLADDREGDVLGGDAGREAAR